MDNHEVDRIVRQALTSSVWWTLKFYAGLYILIGILILLILVLV